MEPEIARHDSESPDDPRVGSVLQGRYRIQERLAAGGMGVVYKGERLKLGRTVAIKYLHAGIDDHPEATKRFEREAIVMSRLNHPSCVSVIDYGFENGPYIVMPFITGQNLKEILTQGPMEPERALHIVNQILAALAHAHGHGMVHRDIKPANVMLTNVEGTVDHAYVLDFGLAKFCTGGLNNDITASYVVVGTPAYMSPEQARGGEVDESTDIYSTGALLFELLTGDKLYSADNPLETLQMHQSAPIPSLHQRRPEREFSSELEALVERALAKTTSARFSSATEFAEALLSVPEADFMPRSVSAEQRALAADGSSVDLDDEISAVLGQDLGLDGGAKRKRTTGQSRLARRATPRSNKRLQKAVSLADTMAVDGQGDGAEHSQSPAESEPDGADSADPAATPPTRGDSSAADGVPQQVMPVSSAANTISLPRDDGKQAAATPAAKAAKKPAARASLLAPLHALQDRFGPLAYGLLLLPLVVVGAAWLALGGPSDSESGAGNQGSGDEIAPEQPAGDEAAQPAAAAAADEAPQANDAPDPEPPEETSGDSAQAANGSDSPPPKAASPPAAKNQASKPALSTFDEVEQLIRSNRRDEAIARINKLLRTSHKKNPYLNFLLGNVHFDKKSWSLGLKAYESALRKRPDYRTKTRMINNAVRALGSDKTRRTAERLFTRYIKKAGVSALQRASRSDKNRKVRLRAKALLRRLPRR